MTWKLEHILDLDRVQYTAPEQQVNERYWHQFNDKLKYIHPEEEVHVVEDQPNAGAGEDSGGRGGRVNTEIKTLHKVHSVTHTYNISTHEHTHTPYTHTPHFVTYTV